MTDQTQLLTLVHLLDEKLEQFIQEHNNYPRYLLMGYETYIDFYRSHFVYLSGQMPLTLNINEYKNVEIVLVPHTKRLLDYSGFLEETDYTLLELCLKEQMK